MTCSAFDVTSQVLLQSDIWRAVVLPRKGGNLVSLIHRPSGLNVLRTPAQFGQLNEQPERYGIPILFLPNRIEDGTFTFEGRVYRFSLNDPMGRHNHLHGLVLGKSWDVIEQSKTHVLMQYRIAKTAGFPHECTLQLAYRLGDDGLSQRMSVTNDSDLNMPVGLGYHTAFTMTKGSQVWPTVTNEQWEIIQPRMLPSGRLIELPKDILPFGDEQEVSLHCPMGIGEYAGQSLRGAVITHPTFKQAVIYEVDEQFKHWYFWNQGGRQGFFCVEPLTWMANAMNMALPASITGVQLLAHKATWSAMTQIRVQPINA
ncbi:MAG: aldose 1-epimerase [Phycisphaeraceae bacterium JB051]